MMRKILSDKQMTANLNAVKKAKKINTKELAKALGITPQNASAFLNGHRRVENIVPNLIQIGVSADWLLTGKGEMFLKDIRDRNELSTHYEQIGRTMHEVFKSIQRQEETKKEQVCPRFGEETNASIPLYSHTIAAGLAEDSTSPVEEYLELPHHMVTNQQATYAVRASGDSMLGAGIEEGDTLIVDSSLEARHQNIIIGSINGEQTVKKLWIENEKISLLPGNPHYKPVEITQEMDFRILGVVTWVIRKTA